MSNTRECEFCGETIPVDETKCHLCGERREEDDGVQRYADLPQLRRSGPISLLIAVGFCFCIPPLLWTGCIMLLTGDVYFDERLPDGRLETWGIGSRLVAGLLLVAQTIGIVAILARR